MHNGDVHGTIADMNDFYKKLVEVLPPYPDVFVRSEEMIKQKVNKVEFTDEFSKVVLVANDGKMCSR